MFSQCFEGEFLLYLAPHTISCLLSCVVSQEWSWMEFSGFHDRRECFCHQARCRLRLSETFRFGCPCFWVCKACILLKKQSSFHSCVFHSSVGCMHHDNLMSLTKSWLRSKYLPFFVDVLASFGGFSKQESTCPVSSVILGSYFGWSLSASLPEKRKSLQKTYYIVAASFVLGPVAPPNHSSSVV